MTKKKSRRLKTPNGAGSLIQRADGRWMARYTAIDPNTAQSVRKALYGANEQEARAKLIDALSARQNGSLTVRHGREQTLQQWADHWLANSRTRPRTVHRYRELFTMHVLPTLGAVKLSALESRHVNSLMTAKLKTGLSPASVNHVRSLLRNCLNQARKDGLVTRNAGADANAIPTDVPEMGYLTTEQARELLELAETHPDGTLWTVALTTGLRQSELLGLRWSDVEMEDCQNASLTVNRTIQRLPGGQYIEQAPKSKRSRRTIPLLEVACASLQRQKSTQAQQRLKAGKRWAPEFPNLIFTADTGQPISGTAVTRRFQAALVAAGLPFVTFHGLRHSTASLLVSKGVPARVAMELLGHANISTTLNIYSHVGDKAKREAADAIREALSR